jgi:hypothetical protein
MCGGVISLPRRFTSGYRYTISSGLTTSQFLQVIPDMALSAMENENQF